MIDSVLHRNSNELKRKRLGNGRKHNLQTRLSNQHSTSK